MAQIHADELLFSQRSISTLLFSQRRISTTLFLKRRFRNGQSIWILLNALFDGSLLPESHIFRLDAYVEDTRLVYTLDHRRLFVLKLYGFATNRTIMVHLNLRTDVDNFRWKFSNPWGGDSIIVRDKDLNVFCDTRIPEHMNFQLALYIRFRDSLWDYKHT